MEIFDIIFTKNILDTIDTLLWEGYQASHFISISKVSYISIYIQRFEFFNATNKTNSCNILARRNAFEEHSLASRLIQILDKESTNLSKESRGKG